MLCAAALLLCTFTAYTSVAADERPNVVVILVDDMGFSDIGCYGSEDPDAEHRRARRSGVRFTQFYNTARCSPTRAALLTGLYPHQAGMGLLDNMVVPGSKGTRPAARRLRHDGRGAGRRRLPHLHDRQVAHGPQHGTPPWKRGFDRSLNSPVGDLYFPNQQQRRQDGITLNGEKKEKDDPIFGKNWYSTDLWSPTGA